MWLIRAGKFHRLQGSRQAWRYWCKERKPKRSQNSLPREVYQSGGYTQRGRNRYIGANAGRVHGSGVYVFDNGGMYYILDTIKSEINIKFNIHLLRLSPFRGFKLDLSFLPPF